MISRRAEEIFFQAHACSPETRVDFVATACGNDRELLDEVNSLLQAANHSEAYFERLSGKVGLGALAMGEKSLPENHLIGQWRLKRLLGRGGMGSVYLAERADDQYEKQAALKIIPRGVDSGDARERFLRERQILARLVHDNIARLLDGGVTEDGVPYFVMDYVQGLPIDEYCSQNALTTERKLSLVLAVAKAVQYAHRNLVIHRDLKPGNVLVTENGHVRLLDFGIAKILEPDPDNVHLTRAIQRPATPAYASPEMLCGETVDVTTDVYSIGVLLYVLLAGRVPVSYEGLGLSEMRERAMTAEPPLVSHYDGSLHGDIDAIVAKALARQPADRYASVESLVNDIRNHLQGLPVEAKTPTPFYRAAKFLARHRVGVAFSAFAVAALASIALLAVRFAVTADRQAREIALERDRAEATKEFLISIFDAADPNLVPGEQTAQQILANGRKRIVSELAGQPLVQADLLNAMGQVFQSWRLTDDGREVLEQERDLRATSNGRRTREYADVLARLSQFEDMAGNYEKSLAYGRESLAISNELKDSLGQAAGHIRVGRVLHLLGDYDGADPEYRRAIDIYRKESGHYSLESAQAKIHLANLLNHQQRYDEALILFQEALATREEAAKGDSADITEVLIGMASTLHNLGRLDEAEAAYGRGIAINDRLFGPDNTYNAYIVNGLGKIAESRGDYGVALAHYEDAARLVRMHFPDSPDLGIVLSNVGKSHALMNRCDLALEPYAEAVEILATQLPEHWMTGSSRASFGRCLAETGSYADAEPLILTGMEAVSNQWGPEHALTQQAKMAAEFLYDAWGKSDQASRYRISQHAADSR